MEKSQKEGTSDTLIFFVDASYYVGLCLPPFNLMDILKKLYGIMARFDKNLPLSIYGINDKEIGGNILVFAVSGLVYLILCIAIDMKVFIRILDFFDIKESKYPSLGKMDEDVKAEVEKAHSLNETEIAKQNLVAMKISKFFGNFLAVNQLSFCVEPGECFGL